MAVSEKVRYASHSVLSECFLIFTSQLRGFLLGEGSNLRL